MPRRADDGSNLPPSIKDWLDSLSPDQLTQLLPRIMALGAEQVMEEVEEQGPSRLREPLDEVVTYRVRVDLQQAEPPIWRRVELASDLTLDVLHRVLQVVMGWTDSHLHGFSSGGQLHTRGVERYLTEFDIEEGDVGVAEADVRLDQVLQDVGDELWYEYDFGDGWTHLIVLEAVEPRADDVPTARCLTGERACPPEDVGGLGGYEELLDARAGRLEDAERTALLLRWAGPDLDPDRFSADQVNERLRFALTTAELSKQVPEPIASMLDQADQSGRPLLEELVARADLDDDTPVPVDVAERMVAPYAWLLRRIGPEGVKLTSAGYLPPAVVAEVVAELGIRGPWTGKTVRENHAGPVLLFRETARLLGLVTKRSGRLTVTAAGRKLVDDPVALWQHIASRLPLGKDDVDRQAGVVMLLMVAADAPDGWTIPDAVAHVLSSLGWGYESGPVAPLDTWQLARATRAVLVSMGALTDDGPFVSDRIPTPDGRLLARAALRSL